MKQQIFTAVCTAALLLGAADTGLLPDAFAAVPAFAAEEETPAEGSCGDKLHWAYDADTNILTISGTGDMKFTGDEAPWVAYSKDVARLVLGSGMTSIAENAFAGFGDIESVTVPESVRTIGGGAFAQCTLLESVTLPAGLEVLESNLFSGCTHLAAVKMPDRPKTIGSSAFSGCTALKDITLPAGLESIQSNAFYHCTALSGVTLPESLTLLDSGAFQNCSALKSIVIPENVPEIMLYTFSGCSALESVRFAGAPESFGFRAFGSCTALKDLDIPGSIRELGNEPFYGCTALKTVTLHEGLSVIQYGTFSGCSALEAPVLPETLTQIGDLAFYACAAMTEIVIPAGVESIGNNAFAKCDKLEKITVLNPQCDIYTNEYFGENTLNDPEKTVIAGYKDSTAQAYAEEYGYEFERVVWDVLPGDLSADDAVTLEDILTALEVYSYMQMGIAEPTEAQLAAGDVNADGTFDLIDIICILQYYNYNEVLGIGASWEDVLNEGRKITDLAVIREMLDAYIQENAVPAMIVDTTGLDTNYITVLYRVQDVIVPALITKFIEENNIDPACVHFTAME